MNSFVLITYIFITLLIASSASRTNNKKNRCVPPKSGECPPDAAYNLEIIKGKFCCIHECEYCGFGKVRYPDRCNGTCMKCRSKEYPATKPHFKHMQKCKECKNCDLYGLKSKHDCTDTADTVCSEECIDSNYVYDKVQMLCTKPSGLLKKLTTLTSTTVVSSSMSTIEYSSTNIATLPEPKALESSILEQSTVADLFIVFTAVGVVIVMVILGVGLIFIIRRWWCQPHGQKESLGNLPSQVHLLTPRVSLESSTETNNENLPTQPQQENSYVEINSSVNQAVIRSRTIADVPVINCNLDQGGVRRLPHPPDHSSESEARSERINQGNYTDHRFDFNLHSTPPPLPIRPAVMIQHQKPSAETESTYTQTRDLYSGNRAICRHLSEPSGHMDNNKKHPCVIWYRPKDSTVTIEKA